MPHFTTTGTILDKILTHKVEELAARKVNYPLSGVIKDAQEAPPARDILLSLNRETVALIAEVKHASPSKGVLIEDFDPKRLAESYANNGAAALSILTDEKFFLGHLEFLARIRQVVDLPLLRKDFIFDPYQVYETRAAGADALLLIVAALDDHQLRDLHTLSFELGMQALIEVHNQDELERALVLNPALLGVNNRDLRTFKVDLETTARLIARVPLGVTIVAESGIQSPQDVRRMGQLGAFAVLVGEALVKSENLPAAVRAFSRQPRFPLSSDAGSHARDLS